MFQCRICLYSQDDKINLINLCNCFADHRHVHLDCIKRKIIKGEWKKNCQKCGLEFFKDRIGCCSNFLRIIRNILIERNIFGYFRY
jgi:hypothetical protein